ncbi:hypothetical protein QFZ70_002908 [Arthrobacter sp. V1I9]|uniref:hypothetical protein n=1 Tax=Arthrobacter sp. V1I9 TaxID=3042275 RepID=UPI002791DF4B|nr:hypothetical protein [Arthrobacter sp. V1I9]MDQ0870435.1 hypothetical protein [Arthrobacter sp. V1I9]
MEYLVGFGGFVVFMVVLRALNGVWQRKHRRTRPPRHQGEPQSQRGRVYKNPPPTNHNADPYSGWH